MEGATQQVEEQTGVVRLLYLHQDRLGSLVMATEKLENGSVSKAGHAAYDPYGRPVWLEAWGENNLQDVLPYGYAGARWDDEAAPEEDTNQDGTADRQVLNLMGARWYDPELGRFLEQDPIGEAGGLNLYASVGSSPTLFVDPSGLRPQMMGNSAQRGNMFQERRGGARITIDGVNRSDVLTGNQMFGLNYRMDGGGLSDPEALKAQKVAVMAQWKAKSKKSQGTTPTSGMAAAGENTAGATEASSPIWTPPNFDPPETGSTRGSSEADSPVWAPPNFTPTENSSSGSESDWMFTPSNLSALSIILMSEASIANRDEKIAVGWTAINRMLRNGTLDVCKVAKAYSSNNENPTKSIVELATELLKGEIPDNSNGATHYYSPISMPKEGESTEGYDVKGGLEETPGVEEKNYRPSWADTFWQVEIQNVRPVFFKFFVVPGIGPVR